MQATSPIFVFAHGAGAPMDSPFMEEVAAGLTARGIRVVRFEFPYMVKRREVGRATAPDKTSVLEACFREVVQSQGAVASQVAIGGKSLGGRIATHVADGLGVSSVVAFGFPFFPPKQAGLGRFERLLTLRTPTLVLQGTRDPFGGREQLDALTLPSAITMHYLEDGDHSFEPRKKSGRTLAQNMDEAIEVAGDFLLTARAGHPRTTAP